MDCYEISVCNNFSSAHYLKGYNGKCSKLHGHNWKVILKVRVKELDNVGIGLDFKDLKKILKNSLEHLDHTELNNISFFQSNNPTAENIAKYLYGILAEKIKEKGGDVYKVTIEESPGNEVTYYRI